MAKKKTVKELLAERENIDAKKKEINKALRAARAAEKAEKERQEREKEISEALSFYRDCKSVSIRLSEKKKKILYEYCLGFIRLHKQKTNE